MNRREALKTIGLVPLGLYFLSGAIIPEVPKLLWYQTPYEDGAYKIGLKANWPNGEQFGYICRLIDMPRNLNFFSKDSTHPTFELARGVLTRMALAKEEFPPFSTVLVV